jgi:hypothetical protein
MPEKGTEREKEPWEGSVWNKKRSEFKGITNCPKYPLPMALDRDGEECIGGRVW